MSLYLLLSTDAQLETELEILLETGSYGMTLVRASAWDEIAAYQESLQDIDAILLDLDTFNIPEHSPLPLILLGSTPTGGNENFPSIPKPLPADTASQLRQRLPSIKNSSKISDAASHDQKFVIGLLRELVHDLNNQFTTLRGNLPLINTPEPEDKAAVADMIQATENANRLVHIIEAWFPDARPEHRIFPLADLVHDFTHFANKLYAPGIQCVFDTPPSPILISGDPALLCGYLLHCLPFIGDQHSPLRIELGHESSRDLELVLSGDQSPPDLNALQTSFHAWLQTCPSSLMHCRLEGTRLICRLPKRLRL